MVQIHSPRPLLVQSATHTHTNSPGAPAPGPGGQWLKRMRPNHSFHSQINALRCGLNCNFYFILTDNTDNIGAFEMNSMLSRL